MAVKNHTGISLTDFIKKNDLKAIKGIFGEESLNEDGTIMSMNEQAAIITHYLKLKSNPQYASVYKCKGEELLRLWGEFVGHDDKETSQEIVCEDTSHYKTIESKGYVPQYCKRIPIVGIDMEAFPNKLQLTV